MARAASGAQPGARPGPHLFFGWWIALASAAMAAYTGGVLFYGFGAFFNPLVEEFGWSRAALAGAFALLGLEGAVVAPVVGWTVDRFGTRKLMLLGVGLSGLGFLGLSAIGDLVGLYALLGLVALGFGPLFSGPSAAVANWFVRRRSLALGMMLAGYGFSGALVPGVVWAIAHWGWRGALIAIGLGTWALCFPLSLVVRHRPEPYGHLPDGDLPDPRAGPASGGTAPLDAETSGHTLRQAMATPPFWLLSLAFALSWLALNAVIVHFIPYLISIGIAPETAALAVTFLTGLSVVGRLGFGFLGDLMNKRRLVALCFLLQGVALLIFASLSEGWHLVLFLAIMGPAYGGPVPLRFAIQGDYFGVRAFATISGVMMAATTVGSALSPVFAGWVYDSWQSYRLAWVVLSLFALAAAPVVLLVRPPQDLSGIQK